MGNLPTSARSAVAVWALAALGVWVLATLAALAAAGRAAAETERGAGSAAAGAGRRAGPGGAAAGPGAVERLERPLRTLGGAAVATLGSAGADRAVRALGDSLALVSTRWRLEREPRPGGGDPRARGADERGGAAGGSGGAADDPGAGAPRPERGYGSRAGRTTYRLVDGVAADPSELPPASAGSNGTAAPRSPAHKREAIFARRPGGDPELTSILLTGIALPPPVAPEAVKGVINNANRIVGRPYIWGGGHASFYSHGYDCSGAVSFALFGGGLIPRPLTSGELMRWGAPGPGKWITVYANPEHTFAVIAGLRYDTSGVQRGTGPRWHLNGRPTGGFVARHPPGL